MTPAVQQGRGNAAACQDPRWRPTVSPAALQAQQAAQWMAPHLAGVPEHGCPWAAPTGGTA